VKDIVTVHVIAAAHVFVGWAGNNRPITRNASTLTVLMQSMIRSVPGPARWDRASQKSLDEAPTSRFRAPYAPMTDEST